MFPQHGVVYPTDVVARQSDLNIQTVVGINGS